MIQRIQSLYFLIVAALMAVMLFVPLATLYGDGSVLELTAWWFRRPVMEITDGLTFMDIATPCLGGLFVACALLPLVTIFLYKRRMLQIRLCYVEMVLLLGAQAMVGYYLYTIHSAASMFADGRVVFSPADVLPLAGVVLMWLALRGVIRDESLVRSLDRVR